MKFLIEMNLSPRWVDALRAAGLSAEHWSSIGRPDAADAELVDHARRNGMAIVTSDRDFSAILAATGGVSPSVIQLRSDALAPEALAPAVIGAIRRFADDISRGAIVTVDVERSRLRVLPLSSDG